MAAVGGALAAWHYHTLGLTLSHYDARGHLIVARRIVDSITPGWQQIGAVWLPLPHLLNAIPVQIDVFYRTGASAVAISIVAFALAAGAIAWIIAALTGVLDRRGRRRRRLRAQPERAVPAVDADDRAAAARDDDGRGRDADAMVLRPTCRSAYSESHRRGRATIRQSDAVQAATECRPAASAAVGVAFALACLTRYEAWPVTVSALVAAAWARWRRGQPLAPRVARRRRDRRSTPPSRSPASRSSAASSSAPGSSERLLRPGEQGARRPADGRGGDRLGRADAERHRADVDRRRRRGDRRRHRPGQPQARRRARGAGAARHGRRSRGPRFSKDIRSASATWCR